MTSRAESFRSCMRRASSRALVKQRLAVCLFVWFVCIPPNVSETLWICVVTVDATPVVRNWRRLILDLIAVALRS